MPQKTVDDFYCPVCKSCPLITDYCPNCSRIEGSSGLIFDKVVHLEDQVRVWRESYDELERQSREQIAKLETRIAELLDASTHPAAPVAAEPFGYFRADPFGWTECSETDEGAVALYEHPVDPSAAQESTK